MSQEYGHKGNEASYNNGSSYAVSMSPSFEVSYSHSPSASQIAMYAANVQQGYSNLPAKLDYMISEALKDLAPQLDPEFFPVVREQESSLPIKHRDGQMFPVEPSLVVIPNESQLREQELMRSLDEAKRITLTEVE